MSDGTTQIVVRIPEEWNEELRGKASEVHESVATLVREAIRRLLEKESAIKDPPERGTP